MKLKLDENFDIRLVGMLTAESHDVDTVLAEGLSGCKRKKGASVISPLHSG